MHVTHTHTHTHTHRNSIQYKLLYITKLSFMQCKQREFHLTPHLGLYINKKDNKTRKGRKPKSLR